MKAVCKNKICTFVDNKVFIVDEGTIVDYNVENTMFIVYGLALTPAMFFNHFKVTKGEEKLGYDDFEYILCNYVFGSAVLFPNEYSGVHHLIIQNWGDDVIMITSNKNEDLIRVSFNDMQQKYTNYEDALEGIKNHKSSK